MTVLDLSTLRQITDGDKDIECQLFQAFIASSEESIQIMRISIESGDHSMWRTQAHAMKGSSANLGAENLRALCLQAQNAESSNANDKLAILNKIEEAYEQVRDVLQGEMSAA